MTPDERDQYEAKRNECAHVWESGQWGVIIGVSRCTKCGRVSRYADFGSQRGDNDA